MYSSLKACVCCVHSSTTLYDAEHLLTSEKKTKNIERIYSVVALRNLRSHISSVSKIFNFEHSDSSHTSKTSTWIEFHSIHSLGACWNFTHCQSVVYIRHSPPPADSCGRTNNPVPFIVSLRDFTSSHHITIYMSYLLSQCKHCWVDCRLWLVVVDCPQYSTKCDTYSINRYVATGCKRKSRTQTHDDTKFENYEVSAPDTFVLRWLSSNSKLEWNGAVNIREIEQ